MATSAVSPNQRSRHNTQVVWRSVGEVIARSWCRASMAVNTSRAVRGPESFRRGQSARALRADWQ